tara:strand:- start:72 stop:869 length:798 start_codon:yes stop_codon:yes gene_type:complete
MISQKKLVDLEKFLFKGKKYKEAIPFPYCFVDDLWDSDLLKAAEKDINEFKNWDGEKDFYGAVGKRFCNTFDKLPESVKNILYVCNSPRFIRCLEEITGDEGLIPDPYFEGGGIHSTINRGFLKMHTDFNWYSKLKLYRRLNLIIYLNSNWKKEWKGNLKLGLKNKNNIKIFSEISPIFNRSILFTTTNKTYHGHPESLEAPDGKSRNSIAIYYYVSKRPKGGSLLKRTGTIYRKIDDGKKFVGELRIKNLPRKIKSLIKIIFQK